MPSSILALTSTTTDHLARAERGFSLVEIVISMAIFSMGMLAMFALLPDSLSSMTTASSRSIERRIAKNLINEIMLNEWDVLHRYGESGNQKRYFDSQGIELRKRNAQAIFTARIRVLPRDVNLDQNRTPEKLESSPGGSFTLPDDRKITKATNQHARRVVIEVTDVPLEDFDFSDPANAHLFRTFSTVVVNFRDIDALQGNG